MVSDEDTETRTHKALLMPWVKFLWEGYRTVLEVLRNNAKLEALYNETAQEAFTFCLKFNRRNEFGRLCDQLRRHFTNAMKYQNQPNAIDLGKAESLQLHLETRFEQLNAASKMELWKTAFATIEDISNLMDMSSRGPKPQMQAMYYRKLAMVFWTSEDYVYHAASRHRLFAISKEHKKTFSKDEAEVMASCVLLSTLAIPITNPEANIKNDDLGFASEKNLRLCALVGMSQVPTREQLMQNLLDSNIMQHVSPELKDLYSAIEEQFQPLQLSNKVKPIFEFLSSQDKYKQYVKPLQHIVMLRLLRQLSQVYTAMKLTRLYQLLPFMTPYEIEYLLVEAVTKRIIVFRLNHREQSLVFGSTLLVASEEHDQGPRLQSLQSEMLRGQLTALSRRLRQASDLIQPGQKHTVQDDRRHRLYDEMKSKISREHHDILGRKQVIEHRKEYIEALHLIREREQQKKLEQATTAQKEAEAKRLADEARLREEAKEKKEREDIEKSAAMEKIEELRKTAVGARAFANLKPEELKNLDADAIMQKQVQLDSICVSNMYLFFR